MSTTSNANLDWIAFGQYVKSTRERLGLSQKDFAQLIGKYQPDIGCIEKGTRQSTVETCFRIAEAFGISPTTLFSKFNKVDN